MARPTDFGWLGVSFVVGVIAIIAALATGIIFGPFAGMAVIGTAIGSVAARRLILAARDKWFS